MNCHSTEATGPDQYWRTAGGPLNWDTVEVLGSVTGDRPGFADAAACVCHFCLSPVERVRASIGLWVRSTSAAKGAMGDPARRAAGDGWHVGKQEDSP